MKWTKKLFFHFFQVAAFNVFILSKSGDKPNKPFLSFLESVVCAWLWQDCVPAVEENKLNDEVTMTARHFIFSIPPAPSKAQPKRACRVCTKKLRTGAMYSSTAHSVPPNLHCATPSTPSTSTGSSVELHPDVHIYIYNYLLIYIQQVLQCFNLLQSVFSSSQCVCLCSETVIYSWV